MITLDELYAVFEENEDEYIKFENVTGEFITKRPDVHAMLIMDRLVPGECDALSHAEHDKVWLEVSLEDLVAAEATTEEDILNLIRCGVRMDGDYDGLFMFV